MPRWVPSKVWDGESCYIIGGGPSLRTFDWSLLKCKRTIGCNSAFLLGSELVDICIFGDIGWWNNIGKTKLEDFGGLVVACVVDSRMRFPDWVLTMDRSPKEGLHGTQLGFNGNTGSLAINLGLILGAKRVYLLGFDMTGTEAQWNWHDLRHEKAQPSVVTNHMQGLSTVARDLPKYFPGCEIINLTDGVSRLNCFPKQSLSEHFGNSEQLKKEEVK